MHRLEGICATVGVHAIDEDTLHCLADASDEGNARYLLLTHETRVELGHNHEYVQVRPVVSHHDVRHGGFIYTGRGEIKIVAKQADEFEARLSKECEGTSNKNRQPSKEVVES